ncbi:MAG: DUF4292 domain-containing protein [Bacteroides sp.]|nr:DUF4292 domain-containing protein [Bacteroides sp.]MBD5355005.1 DUF4292 domain-containing protein [Bacteroides sp.]
MTCRNFSPISRNNLLLTALVMVLSILVSGCHSSRSGITSGGDYRTDPGAALTKSELTDLFNALEGSYGSWETVKMPVTLNLNSPKSVSIGGTLTMERERSVNISFRFFGMEVASLMVTQDSVFATYKLDRIYFAESIRDLMGGFPATVGNLQDLLLGRPFVLGESAPSLSRCRLSGNGTTWTITPDFAPMGMGYDFTVDTPTGNVELLTVNLPSRNPIIADYSDFALSSTGPMAGSTSISTRTSAARFEGEIVLNPKKAEWDKGSAKSWSVPKGYTRVRADEIIKKLNRK